MYNEASVVLPVLPFVQNYTADKDWQLDLTLSLSVLSASHGASGKHTESVHDPSTVLVNLFHLHIPHCTTPADLHLAAACTQCQQETMCCSGHTGPEQIATQNVSQAFLYLETKFSHCLVKKTYHWNRGFFTCPNPQTKRLCLSYY